MRMFSQPGMERFLQQPLASDTVRYSGEPVAVVVAESRYLGGGRRRARPGRLRGARAGARRRPCARASEPGAPSGAGDESRGDGSSSSMETSTRPSPPPTLVVEARLLVQRHGAVPLETRGVVCELDELGGVLTVLGRGEGSARQPAHPRAPARLARGAHPAGRGRRRRRLRGAGRVLPRGFPDPVLHARGSAAPSRGSRTARSTSAPVTTHASRSTRSPWRSTPTGTSSDFETGS